MAYYNVLDEYKENLYKQLDTLVAIRCECVQSIRGATKCWRCIELEVVNKELASVR